MTANKQGILVAATEPGLRERVARALEAAGFNVFRCADMGQAAQALQGAWVDAVVAEPPPVDRNGSSTPPPLRDAIRDCEREHIERVLAYCGGNRGKAARVLGIGLSSLYRKLDEYGLRVRTSPESSFPLR